VTRLVELEPVDGTVMTLVGLLALAANAISLGILRRGQRASMTIRGACLEILGDTLGAAAVLVAGLVIAVTGIQAADGLAAILIGILIVPRAWGLLRESLDVLMEATPNLRRSPPWAQRAGSTGRDRDRHPALDP
jgi:cobalt-zinc-cadmium efflux system protein